MPVHKMVLTFEGATKPRKIPKEGDRKTLKDGTVMVRQQVIHDKCYVVAHGKPVWEWVPLAKSRHRS